MEKYFLIFIICINSYAFGLVWYDKRMARAGKWRLPERQLWLAGIVGGAGGLYLGMQILRHKTKHMNFVIGVPLLILIQVISLWYSYKS